MNRNKNKRLPTRVLEKAREVAEGQQRSAPRAASAQPEAKGGKPTKEKVIAALKRLHPMD